MIAKKFEGNGMPDFRIINFHFLLKHKDSFGTSENLSKIFFGEIVVFDHDYEGISSSSNDLFWITFIFLNNLFELFFELFGGPPNKSMHIYNIKSISIFLHGLTIKLLI